VGRNPVALFRYARHIARDPIGWVRGRFERYGDIYYAPAGKTRLYVVRHPADITDVLVTKAASFEKTTSGVAVATLRKILGEGLLNANGALWRRQRHLVQPAFTKARLNNYAETITTLTKTMLSEWGTNQRRDLSEEMTRLTFRVVAKALFDRDVSTDNDPLARIVNELRYLARSPWVMMPGWLPTPWRSRAAATIDALDALVYDVIDERLEVMQDPDASLGDDMLSALVEGGGMSRRLLRDEALTLYIAGHETTSHMLVWAWHLLGQHPETQQSLQRELREVLGGRTPTPADLPNLALLDQVLCETVRMFPPVYVMSRTACEDVELGRFQLRAGSEVLIWLYMTHHDPRWYPEPDRFDPSRFAPKAKHALPEGAFLPFGLGARTCVGERFAMMQAKLIMATALQRVSVEPLIDHVVELHPTTTLAPKGGLPMMVRPPLGESA
jgi:cytochrome P450